MKPMYSLFDRGITKFMLPFPAETDEDAIRQCKMLFKQSEKSPIVQFAEDYDLYFVGWFNDEEGVLVPNKSVKMIKKLIELKEV